MPLTRNALVAVNRTARLPVVRARMVRIPTGLPSAQESIRRARQILYAAAPDAAQQLVSDLTSDFAEVRTRAAVMILDRTIGRPGPAPQSRDEAGDAAPTLEQLLTQALAVHEDEVARAASDHTSDAIVIDQDC